jgi:5-dehydro-4-deoxyglucarate dehydratase
MPTAEVFAAANRAIGVSTYSSAIFNFAPEYAQRFFAAVHSGDRAFTSEAVRSFFIPYLALRNQRRGYAVSIVKAGLRVVGRPAGPVRAPLLDLTADQEAALARLVARATGALARPSKPALPVGAELPGDRSM